MKDFEQKKFKNENTALDFFNEQEKTDRWIRVYTNEMETAPLENCKLNLFDKDAFSFTAQNGVKITSFADEVTDEDISSSMENSKLSLIFPNKNQMQMYPIRYTAFGHIQERAGITGSSISSLKERKRAYEISAEKRSEILNSGLKLYQDRSLILIRDGKATAVLSGDESDYCIMPMPDILAAVKDELKNYEFKFLQAHASHEVSNFEYQIWDSNIESQIRNELMLENDDNIVIKLVLITSDVGKCSVQLSPAIEINKISIPIGRTLSVAHKGVKAMDAFNETCHKFLSRFNMNLENIRRLNKMCINHPVNCMKNVYESLKITGFRSAFKDVLNKIESEHVSSCTGFDIYYYFCEMLSIEQENRSKNQKEQMSLYETSKSKDIISEILFIDLTSFDY